jgi:hypothetical protein
MQFSLCSTPALAAALRTNEPARFGLPYSLQADADRLVPVYQIELGTVAEEATAAAHVIAHISERLRRLAAAYGEWEKFDAPAYFDLTYAQSTALLKISERVSTVHVRFYVDPLLPSFLQAAQFWQTEFAPAFAQLDQQPILVHELFHCLQPQMVNYWQQLEAVLQHTRALLQDDIGFLATNGAEEERNRWQKWWQQPPPPRLDKALHPSLVQIPTLTLTTDFALPAYRQPDRLRRLRAARERHRRQRRR